jgi:hypothetical protein
MMGVVVFAIFTNARALEQPTWNNEFADSVDIINSTQLVDCRLCEIRRWELDVSQPWVGCTEGDGLTEMPLPPAFFGVYPDRVGLFDKRIPIAGRLLLR